MKVQCCESQALYCVLCSEGIDLVTVRNKMTNSSGLGCVTVNKSCEENAEI